MEKRTIPNYLSPVAERQNDLDKYCQELLALPPYLSECSLVQTQLFGIHEGDVETDQDPRMDNTSTNDGHSNVISNTTPANTTPLKDEVQPITTQSTQNNVKNSASGTIKVKIIRKDEIIAIKVPLNCSFDVLESKIGDRLGARVRLQYKAEPTKDLLSLETDQDVEHAFAMSINVGKLTVYADDVPE